MTLLASLIPITVQGSELVTLGGEHLPCISELQFQLSKLILNGRGLP